jgi:phosphopantetheinyl transferase
VKHKLRVICPQIRKALIELPFSEHLISYLDLSTHIVKTLGLDPSLKALLYNKYGQPFLYNLDLMHFPIPKIDFS